MITNEEIEKYIVRFPIYQYAFLKPSDVEHSEAVRAICKRDCKKYDTNWACPPAVARISKCRARCAGYSDVLLFSTVASTELDEKEKNKRADSKQVHEELTQYIEDYLINSGCRVYTLTSDACSLCPRCTFPHEYCRYPERMHPCIESHGIVITDLAERCSMDYNMGRRLYLWFTMIYYRPATEEELKSDE
ncbi:MAG: DUF2284 domain-containing protein [Lachnospiraceae bacterium]|nr:DUF2284 domain-containing protein [Lachnospiraceae bacterium]